MDNKEFLSPTNLFEVSWEVCNKVGGIHTVVSTKALTVAGRLGDKYIVIGPDNTSDTNNEFEEDPNLLKSWRTVAYREGLRVRVGRWKINGSPIVILVDFSSYVSQKDEILSQLWKEYKVDSISGQWDYVEPVLFGYAAGKVIESYVKTYSTATDLPVAHFHEWMTCAGVLYLKKEVPAVATVFTTHATVMGRCIASNGLKLYSDMDKFNVEELARYFNVMAKHSLEKAAANNCDCFATVSQITSNECEYMLGRPADIITPNGFENDIVWAPDELIKKRGEARKLFITIAEKLQGRKYEKEPLIVGTCGRYEFKNKGLDEFIDALASLQSNDHLGRDILAYILVPGWNNGPRRDLQEALAGGEFHADPYSIANVTHYMGDSENDAILNKLRATGLLNAVGGHVTVMFVPAYLDNFDGIFNKHYYEMLPGFDLTLFPSYYEPWGYTPLESIAFGVPSVTSSLAGFGRWVCDHSSVHNGVIVIERSDSDESHVCQNLGNILVEFTNATPEQLAQYGASAMELSKTALWSNLIEYYYQAYSEALSKSSSRLSQLRLNGGDIHEQINFLKHQLLNSTPAWTSVIVERTLPERLRPLDIMSRNLWWSWTREAKALFESIDSSLWVEVERNPIALLDNLALDVLLNLENNGDFLGRMDHIYNMFKDYIAAKDVNAHPRIAYFSMEYGLHNSLKIYSGGLGILAGDYLKEASDKNIPMVAVGLLYRYGYFTQRLSASGEQEAGYEAQNFFKLPIAPVRDAAGNWLSITLHYPGRDVNARIWRCDVGRTELYLLDTDHEANLDEDRSITHHLYGGDWENRLKQEILLGVGGIKALSTMCLNADVYHCNEGHAAFIGPTRIQELIERQGLSFSEALEVVRSSSLFTTHTPVPAGHDSFPESMMRQYMSSMPVKLKITWEQFISLGRTNPNNPDERFSMSFLACNMSQEVNGVSWLHGEVSKDILGGMWPGYFKDELHIGYVTNGVHMPTWTSSTLQDLYNRAFGSTLATHNYDKNIWQGIYNVSDEELWSVRLKLKNKLIKYIQNRVKNPSFFRFDSPKQIVKIKESLDPNILTIGFARRFATYKRAHLLFTNLERLNAIVNNPERPVQFFFAGKAHPNDKPGQDLIKRIIEVASMPQFVGKILFLQNYDMELARRMVQGVDVWMNTPTRPLEASGTSGEKAVMNGVLHFSVLDGWWVEGYKEGAGWALPMENTFEDSRYQDELDAESIYTIIEEEIAPAYYNRNDGGVSSQWVGFIKKSIADVASNFTTVRMIDDYVDRFYNKLFKRNAELSANNYEKAREVAAWKRKVSRLWEENVYIVSSKTFDVSKEAIVAGNNYKSEVVISKGAIPVEDIGVELVVARNNNGEIKPMEIYELELVSHEGDVATYELDVAPKHTGSFEVAIRVFAKNKELPHRMDFALVKWS